MYTPAEEEERAPYPLVEVEWIDAVAHSAWEGLDDLPEPERAYTVGYMLKRTEDYITLAQTWGLKADGLDEVGHTWSIPMGMVVSLRVLQLAGKAEAVVH